MISRVIFKLAIVLAVWTTGLVSIDVHAEVVETIIDNGAPENRVDIAILGDGYTASQLEQYAQDVSATMASFFSKNRLVNTAATLICIAYTS